MTSQPPDLRAALEGRLQFDALLAELAARFVRLPADLVDAEIERVQLRLCEALGFDRSSIWELRGADSGTMKLVHMVQVDGVPVPPPMLDVPSVLPYLATSILEGRSVLLTRLDQLPSAGARDRESLRQLNTRSIAVFPLRTGEGISGALSFGTVSAEREWPEPVVTRLGLIAQVFADAVGRKRSEEALRQTKDRMAFAAEAAGAGLWEMDLATRHFWGTEKAWALIGLAPDPDLTYERFLQVVHPEDQPLVEEALKIALAGLPGKRVEFRVVKPDGTVHWLRFVGGVRRDQSGQPASIIGASSDITASRQIEMALRHVSSRLIMAQEKERSWLAKELHDGLSQNLALLAVELDLLGQQPPETVEQLRARAAALSAEAKSLSAEVHRLSHGLHPAKLERLGLVAALTGFCREVEAAESQEVRFEAENVPRDLPDDLILCLYRVAQEAIWNALRHSGGSRIDVKLTRMDGAIELTIRDDGRGFDPAAPSRPDSLGLISMRERVAILQGRIAVESAPGQGTSVRVLVPLAVRTMI